MENETKKTSEPAEEQQAPLELVKEVQKELADYRSQFEKSWREYDDAYYGKQHKTGEDKKTVKNHVFKIIEGEVPILTDSMPGTQITSNIEAKQADADNLNKAVKYTYQDQNLPLVLPTLMRSALTSAPGYLYPYYNPDADSGDGKIEYKQLPWVNVFLDGNAQTIEQSEKARIEIPMRREAIARMWPEKRKQILDVSSKSESSSSSDNEMLEERDISGFNSEVGKPKCHKAKDIVKYVETWVKSYDLENIPDEETQAELEKENAQLMQGEPTEITKWENHPAHKQSHAQARAQVLAKISLPPDAPIEKVTATIEQLLQANPEAQDLSKIILIVTIIDNHIKEHDEMEKLNPSGQRPKYMDGWRLIRSVENVLLYDGPNPECLKTKHSFGIPLVPFYAYKDDTIYGFGEVKNIIGPQRTLNDMDQREIDSLQVNGNSGWIADHEAEVDEKKLTNEPGIVIQKRKGTEVRRLEPGVTSPQYDQRKVRDGEFIEDVSGINRESQGNMAASASGVAIQKLQTQAIGRIRLKDRFLQSYSIRRLGIITSVLIINHWTEEKRYRLRGDNSKIEDVVFDPLAMQDLEYTVDISEGSMAGIDKDALNAFFLQLLQGQFITMEEFLMVSDFPKREILYTMLKARQEKEQGLQDVQAQLQELQAQNAQLKGLVNPNLVEGDEKKVFDMASKQALINQMMQEAQAAQQEQAQQQMVNNGANQGQPNNQEMI
jgi:hypothetical protein